MQGDSADQLSHTTDFVINNLEYFAFKKNLLIRVIMKRAKLIFAC